MSRSSSSLNLGLRQIPGTRTALTHNLGDSPGRGVSFGSIVGTDLGAVTG
jgi:hypothetical protein